MAKIARAMTMMTWREVEVESGQWRMILVNENRNHNEMTEKTGSGNLFVRKEELAGEQSCD